MPITDYESEQDRIKRAIAQAMALRADNETPQGRMVSGHFVAPSWAEQLSPLLNQALGGYQQGRGERDQKALTGQIESDHNNWMGQRPKTQYEESTTSEEIPGTVAPGPLEQNATGPLLKTRMVTERTAVEPTDDMQIDWASKGLKNPLSKTIAADYLKDQLVTAPERKLAREFKATESEKAREAKSELLIQQGRNKLEQLTLLEGGKDKTREQNLAIEKMKDKTRREIAMLEAQSRVDAARARAAAAGMKTTPVPPRVINDLAEAQQVAEGLTDSFSTFKPEFGGISGYVDKVSGKYNPFSSKESDQAAAWWNKYEHQSALIERHAKFGTALSASEREAWANATIRDFNNPQLIATNLQKRAELATKFYNNLRNQYISGGHKLVDEAFTPLPEGFSPIPGGGAIPTTQLAPTQTQPPRPAKQQRRKSDLELPPGVIIGAPLPGT
jgi:hypothetical protein